MSVSKTVTRKNSGKWLIFAVIIAGIIFFSFLFATNAKKSCEDSFSTAYDETRQKTYDQFRQKAFAHFEKKSHVSNRAKLTIGNIKEENSLEVLSVSDSWVKISEPDEDADKTTRWMEFNATGVYTIDMSVSEFIIDDYNNYILVKLKTPQLSHIALDDANTKSYLYKYKKGFFELNGNYDSGVKMMLNDRAEALDKLTEQLESNDANLARAKTSAENLIRAFIKNVNPKMNLKDSDIQIIFT